MRNEHDANRALVTTARSKSPARPFPHRVRRTPRVSLYDVLRWTVAAVIAVVIVSALF